MSTLNVTNIISTTISDDKGNIRKRPRNDRSAVYTIVASDVGKSITATANVTVNGAILTDGDTLIVYNNSAASITILAGTGLTLRLSGTATTGNRTLAQRGICTLLCTSANDVVSYGTGLT